MKRFCSLWHSLFQRHFLIFTLTLVGMIAAQAATVIPRGTVWKYLDDGSNQGIAWRSPDFDDSHWASGLAQLGFGDGDEVTVVRPGADPNARAVTTYFRRAFINTNGSFSTLTLHLLRDDGAVVYLNGTEVYRNNMPPGEIAHSTLATTTVGGPEETIQFVSASIPPSLLRAGLNVVAVEVHQVNAASSDMSFDLELVGEAGPQPPILPTINVVATDSEASEGSMLTVIYPGTFTFYRSGNTNTETIVTFGLGGSASNGIDYARITNAVRFAPGAREARVSIAPFYDNLIEGTETVVVILAPPMCAAIFPPPPGCYNVGPSNQATVFITDTTPSNNLPVVTIQAIDREAEEISPDLDRVSNPAVFRITRSGNSNDALQVSYTVRGTASNGVDYATLSGAAEIPAGAGSVDIEVNVLDDKLEEGPESVVLQLPAPPCPQDAPGCYRIGSPSQATATIIDDENSPPTVAITSPGSGTTFQGPTNIMIIANANDPNGYGTLVYVEFFEGTRSLGVRTNFPTADPIGPFRLVWENVPAGEYILTAVATDNVGAKGTSAPVHISVVSSPGGRLSLIPLGAVWRFHDQGADLATSWRDVMFDDSGWAAGPAQLGYGDGDEQTLVGFGPDPMNRYITTYFRRSFAITNPAAVTAINGRLLEDDGAIVYLNGVEVFRSNLPPGPISFNTLATSAAENQVVEFTVSPGLLVAGRNVIAVEMHQNSPASTDISFDLELSAQTGTQPPKLPILTVRATRSEATENPAAFNREGIFTITREGESTAPLTVQFSLSGTAINGTDYNRLAETATIPANAHSITLLLSPINDQLVEGDEVAQLRLSQNSAYQLGEPSSAVVTIHDDEPGTNRPPVIWLRERDDRTLFTAPATVHLLVYANDPEEGSDIRVEFFANGQSIGLGMFTPNICAGGQCPNFSLTWSNVAPGTYLLTATATDGHDAKTTSNPLRITVQSNEPGTALIAAGSVWKYLDDGSDRGSAWRMPNFDDTAWASGPAQLGYGDGDEQTVVSYGSNSQNKHVTTYFRRSFGVTNPASITQLIGRLFEDDGAVVYLNGVEIFRSNLPDGPITFNTLAVNAIENQWVDFSASASLLLAGRNVVAVEMHQNSPLSADLSFDLELFGNARPEPPTNSSPVVQLNSPQSGQIFTAPANIELQAFAQDREDGYNLQVEFFAGDHNLGRGTFIATTCPAPMCPYFTLTWSNVPPGTYVLTARATDSSGATRASSPVQIRVQTSDPGTNKTFIARGSPWKYLDNGSDQGSAWSQPGFDDSGWSTGPAQLGYGDGDESTVVSFGPDSSNKYITTYFRSYFSVADSSIYTALRGRLLQDDGAAVYLNGVEIFRSNLPGGAISYNTLANATVENQVVEFTVMASALVNGQNVIAVEMHQNTPVSGDLSFDLELLGELGPRPPGLPTVNVFATDPDAAESGMLDAIFPGVFTFRRYPAGTNELTVSYGISGTAENGVDYSKINGQLTFAPGQSEVRVDIYPQNDNLVEGTETVRVTLEAPVCPAVLPPPPGCYQVGASGSATVFIRDADSQGTNRPPVVKVTAPIEGAVFQAPLEIAIEATTVDPDGYADTVEFFANDVKIGEVTITFFREPAPGETIHFQFDWSNPPAGTHRLVARTVDNRGARASSAPVTITVHRQPTFGDELHAIGVYSGTAPDGGTSRNHEQGEASVVVNRPGKKVTLFLSAYEPVLWHVSAGPDTIIHDVILGGYYAQAVDGLRSDVPIIRAYYDEGRGTGEYLIAGHTIESVRFQRTLAKLCALTHLDMSSFQGSYQAPHPAPFTIDTVQNDERLRCDYPQPVDLSGLPNLSFQVSFYNNQGGGGILTRNYTLAGPTDGGPLLPSMRVVPDAGGRYFYGTESHEAYRIDSQTGVSEIMPMGSNVPELSWPTGIAADTQRNRILLSSLGGEGHLYAYSPTANQWSLVSSLLNIDTSGLGYHAPNDSIYAVASTYEDYHPRVLYRYNAAGELQGQIPLPRMPFDFGSSGYETELVSVGEYLVLLLEPSHRYFYENGQPRESRIYLIDPRSNEVWLTYRRTHVADADRDGVPDGRDLCPNTPPGVVVNEQGCPPQPRDSDEDGVSDDRDRCPNTGPGAIVNASGCSLAQLCPCDRSWENHDAYIRCVIRHTWEFFRQGLISEEQRREIIRDGVMSNCGRLAATAEPLCIHLMPQTPYECRRDGIQFVISGYSTGTCILECSTDLINWTPVPIDPLTVDGWDVTCRMEGASARFYRVRVER